MTSYDLRWRLAVAMRQPYPSPSETGDVAPPPPTFEVAPAPAPVFETTRDWSLTEKVFALLGAFGAGALLVAILPKGKK